MFLPRSNLTCCSVLTQPVESAPAHWSFAEERRVSVPICQRVGTVDAVSPLDLIGYDASFQAAPIRGYTCNLTPL